MSKGDVDVTGEPLKKRNKKYEERKTSVMSAKY